MYAGASCSRGDVVVDPGLLPLRGEGKGLEVAELGGLVMGECLPLHPSPPSPSEAASALSPSRSRLATACLAKRKAPLRARQCSSLRRVGSCLGMTSSSSRASQGLRWARAVSRGVHSFRRFSHAGAVAVALVVPGLVVAVLELAPSTAAPAAEAEAEAAAETEEEAGAVETADSFATPSPLPAPTGGPKAKELDELTEARLKLQSV